MELDQLRISQLQGSPAYRGADMRKKAAELRAQNTLLSSSFDELKAKHSGMLHSATAADRMAERAEELREKYQLARMINRQQQALIYMILDEIYDDPLRAETIGTLIKTQAHRLEEQEMQLYRYYKLIQLLLQHSDFGRALKEDGTGALRDYYSQASAGSPTKTQHKASESTAQPADALQNQHCDYASNIERQSAQTLSAGPLESSAYNTSACESASRVEDFARETQRIRETLQATTHEQKQSALQRASRSSNFDCQRQRYELFSSIERISTRLEQMTKGIETSKALCGSAPQAAPNARSDVSRE